MGASNAFKQTIQSYLEKRAQTDELFATKFNNPDKNIDSCCTYIMNTVQKIGNNGFADEEVYGMAVHYYDEENIEVGKPVQCNVVGNHSVELTEEDKQEAKNKALEQYQSDALKTLKKKTVTVKKENPGVTKLSLFGDEDESEE